MTENKREKISPRQLFCVLFVSRMSALLITGEISVFGFFAQFFSSLILCLAAYLVFLKVPKTNRALVLSRRIIAFLLGVISVYSIFSFKDAEIPYYLPDVFALFLICVSIIYSASLGIEAVSRLSFLCFVLLLLVVATGVLTNLQNINFKENVGVELYGVSLLNIVKCLDTPVILLGFSPFVNDRKKVKSAVFASLFASYGVALLLYVMCVLVIRNAVKFYEHPVFTLFQLGEIGRYNKLDLLFTSPLLASVFVKMSALFVRCKSEKN